MLYKLQSVRRGPLANVLAEVLPKYKTLDLITAWIWKALRYFVATPGAAAFVATKSVCQGEQAAQFWLPFFKEGGTIRFAHRPFEWSNLATRNAGVTCIIVGIDRNPDLRGTLYEEDERKEVRQIGPYLIEMPRIAVSRATRPLHSLPAMNFGDHPYYGGDLIIDQAEALAIRSANSPEARFLIPLYGTRNPQPQ
jgi:hypothetical protein